MASSASVPPPFLFSSSYNAPCGSSYLIPSFFPPFGFSQPHRRRNSTALVILSSSSSSSRGARPAFGSEVERKQKILESYGLDPSDFISRPDDKPRRRKDGEEKGRNGKRVPLPSEEPKQPPRTTHRLLRVLGGKAQRKKLLSPKGMDVRPMMEVVKGAAFDILQVAGGSPAALRPGRWLDLYSGTGAVGIEAISRGCSEAHFVEMDPWVVSEVLQPNLALTGFSDVSVIHTVRVERFLEQAEKSVGAFELIGTILNVSTFLKCPVKVAFVKHLLTCFSEDKNKKFDYISVTPPYMEVDYSVLMDQLGNSSLVGEDCFILVEYPLKTSMANSCGHLIKISDRRFGRTNLVIYGPSWAEKKRKSKKDFAALH